MGKPKRTSALLAIEYDVSNEFKRDLVAIAAQKMELEN